MRLTVGPLPSAVYWRRRAVVLGALLLLVIVLVYSCSGWSGPVAVGNFEGGQHRPARARRPSRRLPRRRRSCDSAGGISPPPGDIGPPPVGRAAPRIRRRRTRRPSASGPCTDGEMTVTPVPEAATVVARDVREAHSDQEHLGPVPAPATSAPTSGDVLSGQGAREDLVLGHLRHRPRHRRAHVPPAIEREYRVTWNGKCHQRCAAPDPARSRPAGEYQASAGWPRRSATPVERCELRAEPRQT